MTWTFETLYVDCLVVFYFVPNLFVNIFVFHFICFETKKHKQIYSQLSMVEVEVPQITISVFFWERSQTHLHMVFPG